MTFYKVLFAVPLMYARHLVIMDYFNHPKRENSEWIIKEIDRLLEEDKKIKSTTTTTTTTTTETSVTTIKTTNIFGGTPAVATTTAITTPPPPTTTTAEKERKLARILTPIWYKQSEELTQKNIVVLAKSLKKIENLKAEVKIRETLLKRLTDLTEEELQNELREESYYERYP